MPKPTKEELLKRIASLKRRSKGARAAAWNSGSATRGESARMGWAASRSRSTTNSGCACPPVRSYVYAIQPSDYQS